MKRLLAALFASLIISAAAQGAAAQEEPQKPPENTPKISVKVNFLQFEVTVVDKRGKLVPGLGKKSFQVWRCVSASPTSFQNDKKRTYRPGGVCELLDASLLEKQNMPPLRILPIIDASGSAQAYFKGVSEPSIIKLLKAFIPKLNGDNKPEGIRTEDKFALWEISEAQYEILDWTQDIAAAEKALDKMSPSGSSALYDALWVAANRKMRPLSQNEFTKFIVLITDGIDNIRFPLVAPDGNLCPEKNRPLGALTNCRRVTTEDIITALQETGTILLVVNSAKNFSEEDLQNSFRSRLNPPNELAQIARMSGGEYFLVGNAEEDKEAFEKAAERIGKVYILGAYTSSACGWYDLDVEIGEWKNGKFKVNREYTDRAGYRRRLYLKCD